MIKVVKKEYLSYKYLMDELLVKENDYFKIRACFYENGTITLSGILKPGNRGDYDFSLLPAKYCPRTEAYATISTYSSSADFDSVMGVYVRSDGHIKFWIYKELGYDETFYLQFPMKTT